MNLSVSYRDECEFLFARLHEVRERLCSHLSHSSSFWPHLHSCPLNCLVPLILFPGLIADLLASYFNYPWPLFFVLLNYFCHLFIKYPSSKILPLALASSRAAHSALVLFSFLWWFRALNFFKIVFWEWSRRELTCGLTP